MAPLTLRTEIENWPLTRSFRIAGHEWTTIDILVVSLERDDIVGRAEAAGVYYKSETPVSMMRQIEALRKRIEGGIDRAALQNCLPPGGARNALDCALWDLEAKATGCAAWQIAGLPKPQPLRTTFTCGADEPEQMMKMARGYTNARAIKIKLTGEPVDVERVRAVREARPDVWLGIDANQGLTRARLLELMPALIENRVKLIEQPFPIGQDALLEGFSSPIPIAADESCQNLADIPGLVGRFSVVNIKLDKCGGLTEGLAMVETARRLGLDTMVGCMIGTSLAMAPAFVVGQLCTIVDLDSPMLLQVDRVNAAQYFDGLIRCPNSLWGNP